MAREASSFSKTGSSRRSRHFARDGSSRDATADGAASKHEAHRESVSSSASASALNCSDPGKDVASLASSSNAATSRTKASSHVCAPRRDAHPTASATAGKRAIGSPPSGFFSEACSSLSSRVTIAAAFARCSALRRCTSAKTRAWISGTVAATAACRHARHLRAYGSFSLATRSSRGSAFSVCAHSARSHRASRRISAAMASSAFARSVAFPRSRSVARCGSGDDPAPAPEPARASAGTIAALLFAAPPPRCSASASLTARAPRSPTPRMSRFRHACCTLVEGSRSPATSNCTPYFSSTRFVSSGDARAARATVDAAVPRSCSSRALVMMATRLASVSSRTNLALHSDSPWLTMFSMVFTA